MLWLLVFACDGEERELEEQEDVAYGAGCNVGQVAGTDAGTDDGNACRERSDVPLEAAHKGMLEYCGGTKPSEGHPCEWWEIGYLDCWRAGYDMSYPIGWDKSGCEDDSDS
jgi:hypothetical protein